ncbi:radial spoke head 1 [Anaeramoeba flamelloides]|uniref:Radial spoke head 1 n=1 Tax=Anaeramoeba flamelloides TaxID=1746091 RepID=A0AAV7YE31_9EUKA|nr:radial spoke head 1 [Anaeramoeba flamelloides]
MFRRSNEKSPTSQFLKRYNSSSQLISRERSQTDLSFIQKERKFRQIKKKIKSQTKINIPLQVGSLQDLKNFDFILVNKLTLAYFQQFLSENFSSENFNFWQRAQYYEDTFDPIERIILAGDLIEIYISSESEHQVNIDAKTRNRIISNFQKGDFSRTLFQEAQEEIYKLMETDSFTRFKRSKLFKDLDNDWKLVMGGKRPQGPKTERKQNLLKLIQNEHNLVGELTKFSKEIINPFLLIIQKQKRKEKKKEKEKEKKKEKEKEKEKRKEKEKEKEKKNGKGNEKKKNKNKNKNKKKKSLKEKAFKQINPNTKETMFVPMVQLLNLHDKFYGELTKKQSNWDYESLIGDLFLKYIDIFESLFFQFAINFASCIELIEDFIKDNEEVTKLIMEKTEWNEIDDIKSTFEYLLDDLNNWKKYFDKFIECTNQKHPDRNNIEIISNRIIKILDKVEQISFINKYFILQRDLRLLLKKTINYTCDGKIFDKNLNKFIKIKIVILNQLLVISFAKKTNKNKLKFYIKYITPIVGTWIIPIKDEIQKDGIKNGIYNVNENINDNTNDNKNNKHQEIPKQEEEKEPNNEKEKEPNNEKEKELNKEEEKKKEKEREDEKKIKKEKENLMTLNWKVLNKNNENLDEIKFKIYTPEYSEIIYIEECFEFLTNLEKFFYNNIGHTEKKNQNTNDNYSPFCNPKRFLIYTYSNTIKYIGTMSYGKPIGKGSLQYPNGTIFEGNFLDGEKNGIGMIRYSSGSILTGIWKNGKPNGLCKLKLKGNSNFIGNYLNGEKHGFGTTLFENGTIYRGCFKDDQINGKGCWEYTNGDIYYGSVIDGKKHGFGFLMTKDYEYYFGNWKDDLRSGKGKQIYKNNEIFTGVWEKNLRVSGVLESTNRTFKGKWKNNLLHGNGSIVYSKEKMYKGEFKYGLRHGLGTLISGNLKYEGQWVDNYPEGEGYLDQYLLKLNINEEKSNKNNKIIQKISGFWSEGRPNKSIKIEKNDKLFFKGKMKDGEKNGEGIMHLQNGDTILGTWQNDIFQLNKKIIMRSKKKEYQQTLKYFSNKSELLKEFSNGRTIRESIGNITEMPSLWISLHTDFDILKRIWY